ncbi:ABC transporter permease [Desulfolucanica intricata]|uniref:ABC transporter permease n=1 Tax=Desulfolucanica intricata TaxID=1285191 RepID=UPI00082CD443|nr:ABC transporter permease [Desulfolucanica intricata]
MLNKSSIANYILAFLFIVSLNFILPRLMPGDPLQAIYGDEALVSMTPELKAELIRRFSLDQSIGEQFVSYVLALGRGDLGHSYYYNAPVLQIILGYLPWTILLVGLTILISTTIGFILGIESGYKRGRALDKTLLSGLMFVNGFPDFFVGILMLLLFGAVLGLVPLAGAITPYAEQNSLAFVLDILHHLCLPLCTLVLVRISSTYLLTRNTMISNLGEAYILTARAKGCQAQAIKYRHAGRNSLLPVVTNTGLQLAHLITGTLFIELVFSYPGIGSLMYTSLLTRDYPLLQGILLVVTVIVLLTNCLLDVIYKKLDPRVNYAH